MKSPLDKKIVILKNGSLLQFNSDISLCNCIFKNGANNAGK